MNNEITFYTSTESVIMAKNDLKEIMTNKHEIMVEDIDFIHYQKVWISKIGMLLQQWWNNGWLIKISLSWECQTYSYINGNTMKICDLCLSLKPMPVELGMTIDCNLVIFIF